MCPYLGRDIVLHVGGAKKEEEVMNHHMDFDPYLNWERNEQVRDEVNALRLEKRLRKGRTPHGLRMVALGRTLISRTKPAR